MSVINGTSRNFAFHVVLARARLDLARLDGYFNEPNNYFYSFH
jgi:hypothetical protein